MDYWEYLAHGQKGAERDDHRYYARELVGNRGGKNVYRYFYSAEEYASYRRSKGSHAGAATNEKESLLDKARKSHRENRWRPDMIISTGDSASVTYKNSAGKKRHTDYMGTDATRKAESEFKRKGDDENYTKNRDRMELVYQTDKALRRAKRKAQKLGMDIKRNAKKGASVVSNLLNRRKRRIRLHLPAPRPKRPARLHGIPTPTTPSALQSSTAWTASAGTLQIGRRR